MKITQIKLILSTFVLVAAQALAQDARLLVPAPPLLGAKAYVLMDATTGAVLVEKRAHQQLPPASLTKLMTAYLVSKHLNSGNIKLDDLVPISAKAWKTGGSKMYIEVGDKVSVNDLLHGIIINSGNDASVAMAEYMAGSEEVFAHLMNQEAQKLGMHNTNFKNASGLPTPNDHKLSSDDDEYKGVDQHYSSAYDIALLAQAIIRDDPDYYYLYAVKEFSYNKIPQSNRNTLLSEDPSVDGLKTGMTDAAGYCLAASSKRGEQRLIAVVLNSKGPKSRSEEGQKLLNYGFQFYQNYVAANKGEALQSKPVFKGELDNLAIGTASDAILTIAKGQELNLITTTNINAPLIAPIKKGDVVGSLQITYNQQVLKQVDLVALHDVNEGSFFKRIMDAIKLWWQGLFN